MEKRVGTFVTVGNANQNFDRLWAILAESQDALKKPVYIQRGNAELPQKLRGVVDFDFVPREKFEELVALAETVICHAGVGTVLMCHAAGKKPIVIPRLMEFGEHVDNHQLELANVLAKEGVAHIASSRSDLEQILALDDRHFSRRIVVEAAEISGNFASVLCVASVGGHMEAARIHTANLKKKAVVTYLTDEDRPSSSTILVFPSCNRRYYFPIRFVRAVFFLRKRKPDIVVTTGAGVGAVFVAAARACGIRIVAIESLTRIDRPGLWFRMCSILRAELWRPSWSNWSKRDAKSTSEYKVYFTRENDNMDLL